MEVLPLLWSPVLPVSEALWSLLSTFLAQCEASHEKRKQQTESQSAATTAEEAALSSPLNDVSISFSADEATSLGRVCLHLCSVLGKGSDGQRLLETIGNLLEAKEEEEAEAGGLARLATLCGPALLRSTADAKDTVTLIRCLGPFLSASSLDALRKRVRGWSKKGKVSVEVLSLFLESVASTADGLLSDGGGEREEEAAAFGRLLTSSVVPCLRTIALSLVKAAAKGESEQKRRPAEFSLNEVRMMNRSLRSYVSLQSLLTAKEEGWSAAASFLGYVVTSPPEATQRDPEDAAAVEVDAANGNEPSENDQTHQGDQSKGKESVIQSSIWRELAQSSLCKPFLDSLAPPHIERRIKEREEYIELRCLTLSAIAAAAESSMGWIKEKMWAAEEEHDSGDQILDGDGAPSSSALAVAVVDGLTTALDLAAARKEDGHDDVRRAAEKAELAALEALEATGISSGSSE